MQELNTNLMSKDSSIVSSFSTHLRKALTKAMDFASEFGHKEVTAAHLLYGLAAEKGSLSSELLTKANFPLDLLKQELVRKYHSPYLQEAKLIPVLNDDVITLLTKAVRTAQLHEHTYVGTEHVLTCLLNTANDDLAKLFRLWQISITDLQRQILTVLKSTSKFPDLAETLRHLQSNQDQLDDLSPEFPMLEYLAKELTTEEAAQSFTPLIGRDSHLERTQQILSRRFKNNPLLIGKPGVGKTAIAEGLAKAIMDGTVPEGLRGKRIFSLELGTLVAGTMYRGEFEQRIKGLVDELRDRDDIILFIDELHTLVGAGSTGQPLDAANILKPALARGEIRCIGATTWREYQKHLAQDAALSRRFQTISVGEPNREETQHILEGVKKTFEDYHQVKVSQEVLLSALDLSDRFLTHTCWPDKAIDLIDEASALVSMNRPENKAIKKKEQLKKKISVLQNTKADLLDLDKFSEAITIHEELTNVLQELNSFPDEKPKKLKVQKKHLHQALAHRTGIEVSQFEFQSKPIGATLMKKLTKTIIGQDEAMESMTKCIQRSYSPLKDPRKLFSSFLFLGPSGVGKTLTAKTLAHELFGTRDALIQLDMSEFSEKYTLSKLIGAPAGYIGYQESGQLTNAVRQNPLSVVLFDEIEKAHPDIFNILLQVLDEGRLRDGSGDIVDFRHTIIILTSNLGLEALQHQLGFGKSGKLSTEQIESEMGSAAKSFFRTELLNRLESTIYFKPLGIEARKAIIQKRINQLNDQLIGQAKLRLSDEVFDHIAQKIYQEVQGARSLEQIIREQIEQHLTDNWSSLTKQEEILFEIENEKIILK